MIGGITGSVFPYQTFNESGSAELAVLLKLQSVGSSKQLVHRVFQRYPHRRDENFRWMRSATDRRPGMIETIENQLSGIDERAVQIEEDGFALMDLRKNHVVVFVEESCLRQFTIRIGKRLELRVARFYRTPLMLHLLRTCYVLKPMNQTATPRRIGIIISGTAHNEAAFVYP